MLLKRRLFQTGRGLLLLLAPFLFCIQLLAGPLPPCSILRDAAKKAEAVIKCQVVSVQTPPTGFTETTVKIVKVYRGPLRKGDVLRYYSFKEESTYPKALLDHGLIVYLSSRFIDGKKEWGESEELFEFEYSPKLEKRVIYLIRKGVKK